MRPWLWIGLLPLLASGTATHDVRAYGARGDGVAKDTAPIQAAIDAASKEGGGVVLLPQGRYVSGTLHLKSHVTIEVRAGATLLASPDEKDFDPYEELGFERVDDRETSYFHYALLAGENVEHVTISGSGIIEGNRPKRGGPKPIALKNCRYVSIQGVTVRNSPNYAVSFLGCDYVDVDRVTVLNSYADGIDPDSSRYVRISNCYVDSWDDAICPKASRALGRPRSTEHLTVTNCVLRTSCNHFKFGTESAGDFKNIAVTNCVMLRRETGRAAISGISLESVDGSHIDGVAISNITMQDVRTPVFLRLGNRGRGLNPPTPGSLRNVTISNIVANGGVMASSVSGIPGFPVRNVTLDNLNVTMGGKGVFQVLDVPEHIAKYPEAAMFGELPAYALYARHVEGLTVRNLKARWLEEDGRPAVVMDDVRDMELLAFRSDSPGGAPVLLFHQVVGALIQGSRVTRDTGVFLRVSGDRSGEISLAGNDLRRARAAVETAAEVAKGAAAER